MFCFVCQFCFELFNLFVGFVLICFVCFINHTITSMPALQWLHVYNNTVHAELLFYSNYLDLLHIVAACFAGHAVMHAHSNICH